MLLDTSATMSADGWLGICTTTLQHLLRHRLDERDRASFPLFDATTQTVWINQPRLRASDAGGQATPRGAPRSRAASRPSRIGFKETLHQVIGYEA